MQQAIKRFYEDAAAAPVEEGGFTVLLDGRQVRTPDRNRFSVPNGALARAIAQEWAAQKETVDAKSMPLTNMAFTAIDLVAGRRSEVIEEIAAFGETELLCYQAEAPAELVKRQATVWQPILDWAAEHFGAHLCTTGSILPIEQTEKALQALRSAVGRYSNMELAALAVAVKAAGSLVIGLALAAGRICAEEAFAAAELETTYQIELWGEDTEAAKRRAALQADLVAAERFLRLLSHDLR
jgi:chaperone required for assembly of F1-ATPase